MEGRVLEKCSLGISYRENWITRFSGSPWWLGNKVKTGKVCFMLHVLSPPLEIYMLYKSRTCRPVHDRWAGSGHLGREQNRWLWLFFGEPSEFNHARERNNKRLKNHSKQSIFIDFPVPQTLRGVESYGYHHFLGSCLWEETGVEDGFDSVCNEKLRMPTLTKLLLSYQIHVMTQVTSRQPSNWGTFGNQAKLLDSSDSVLRKFSKFSKYLLEMLRFKARYQGVEPAPWLLPWAARDLAGKGRKCTGTHQVHLLDYVKANPRCHLISKYFSM